MNPTNTSEGRTVRAIALYPLGNTQGSWHFMSLATGEGIHRYQWTALPIGQDTINLGYALGGDQEMPQVNGNFTYESAEGEEIVYEDEGENEDMIDNIEYNENNDGNNENQDYDEVNVNDDHAKTDEENEDKGAGSNEMYIDDVSV